MSSKGLDTGWILFFFLLVDFCCRIGQHWSKCGRFPKVEVVCEQCMELDLGGWGLDDQRKVVRRPRRL